MFKGASMRRFLLPLAILAGLIFGSINLFCAEGDAAAQTQTITVRHFLNPDALPARESLATAEGTNFTDMAEIDLFNTPTTLGGVQLLLDGVAQRLRSVTPTRVVFIVDAVGQTTRQVELHTKSGETLRAQVSVVNAWPGLLTQATGDDPLSSLPAGLWVQDPNDTVLHPISEDPLPVGPALHPTQVILTGSGWRYATRVNVRLNGVPCVVANYGPSGFFPGQDELAFFIPPRMAGAGSVDMIVSVAGRESNYTRLNLGAAVN